MTTLSKQQIISKTAKFCSEKAESIEEIIVFGKLTFGFLEKLVNELFENPKFDVDETVEIDIKSFAEVYAEIWIDIIKKEETDKALLGMALSLGLAKKLKKELFEKKKDKNNKNGEVLQEEIRVKVDTEIVGNDKEIFCELVSFFRELHNSGISYDMIKGAIECVEFKDEITSFYS